MERFIYIYTQFELTDQIHIDICKYSTYHDDIEFNDSIFSDLAGDNGRMVLQNSTGSLTSFGTEEVSKCPEDPVTVTFFSYTPEI